MITLIAIEDTIKRYYKSKYNNISAHIHFDIFKNLRKHNIFETSVRLAKNSCLLYITEIKQNVILVGDRCPEGMISIEYCYDAWSNHLEYRQILTDDEYMIKNIIE